MKSKQANTRNAYDSYVKAFRWSTDRIGENGVIGFVSNGSYLNSVAMDGFRQCLLEDFTHIYVFNLRGNQRTSGELSRKEGGKIFGSGSRTPVAITILVKQSGVSNDGFIHYYDIGDYLTREEKLNIISDLGDIGGIQWKQITPNENNDWINQRNQDFLNLIALYDKKKGANISIWSNNYSLGIVSSRDTWVYNFNSIFLITLANKMIDFYNSERMRCNELYQQNSPDIKKEEYIINNRIADKKKISWSRGITRLLCNNVIIENVHEVRTALYRPFCKKSFVHDKSIVEYPSKWDILSPTKESNNLFICVSGTGSKKGFSVIISDCIQDFQLLFNAQSFPMYIYEKAESNEPATGAWYGEETVQPEYTRKEAITDQALTEFRKVYGQEVTKKDIFYYIYAVLQSKGYISAYQDNLSKEMPRIPFLKGFSEYVRIGKALADIHLHYEKPVNPEELGLTIEIDKPDYTVKQMKFPKDGKKALKETIIYNEYIRIKNIPERVYDYIVNGKSAVEWIMERYAITTDKASGITDNPNDYGDEKYIFNLLISVMAVSLKTLDLIDSMPEYEEI